MTSPVICDRIREPKHQQSQAGVSAVVCSGVCVFVFFWFFILFLLLMPDEHQRGGNKAENGPRALPPNPGVGP